MGMTHLEIISKFVNGKSKISTSRSSTVFADNDTLYSFGYHFPLLLRMNHWNGFLLNADRYSFTTSRHQRKCFRHATVQIPFSALRNALGIPIGISSDLKDLELIAKEKERYDLIDYFIFINGKDKHISISEYNKLDSEEQMKYHSYQERRPEACVLKFGDKYFLSSMDENQYFISLLSEPAFTVKEAFSILKPREILYNDITDYKRQGEWFFVDLKVDEKEARKTYNKILERGFILPRPNNQGNIHRATRGGFAMDINFSERPKLNVNAKTLIVSGHIKHPQHRQLHLSTLDNIKLFAAYRGRDVQSWSASGRVD
jgi:hypothetical protein